MEHRTKPCGTRLPGLPVLVLLALTARALPAGGDELDDEIMKIPLWDYSAEFRGALGYKDNVLLSHTNAQGSAFWLSGAEMMVFRLPTGGWQFHFFADATDVRYFNVASVDNEQTALAVAQGSKILGRGWKTALGMNYMFQNQVFDFSANYTNESSVGQVVGHSIMPRGSLRKAIEAVWVEVEFSGTRQWLDAPLDDYWVMGPRVTSGLTWGHGSEVTVAWQGSHLTYDRREQVDGTGAAIADTSLALNSQMAELSLHYIWDRRKRWHSTTGVGYESSRDNGGGFFDYGSPRVSQQLRYRTDRWDVTAQARLAYYEYATQTVSATDEALRRKTMLRLALRAERTLTKRLKAHVGVNWDRSFSSLEFDDYKAAAVSGGLAFAF